MRKLMLTYRIPGDRTARTIVVDVHEGDSDSAAMTRAASEIGAGTAIVKVEMADGGLYNAPLGQESIPAAQQTTHDPNADAEAKDAVAE